MIQVREQYGNIYIRILDTAETFDMTLQRVTNIPNCTFITTTGEWMCGKEQLNYLLLNFDNQIIWNKPLSEIVGDMELNDDLVKKHLEWEKSDVFADFKIQPYPYQKVGAHFLADRGTAAVFDAVGLGKTLQIIGASHILFKRGYTKNQRVLIVTLNSLKRQWAKEVEKFTQYKALAATGTASKRKKIIKGFNQRNDIQFLVINYELLRTKELFDLVYNCNFDIVALDEAQKIKSGVEDNMLNIQPSQVASACLGLDNIPYRFIATATPVTGKSEEIFSLYRFMNPNILGPWEQFRENYCKYHPRYGITGTQNLGQLYYAISPYFIRRTKEMPEIQQQLPKVSHDYVFLETTDGQIKVEDMLIQKLQDLKEQSKSIQGPKIINGNLMSPDQQSEYYDGMIQGIYTFLIENCDIPSLLSHEEASNMSKALLTESGISQKEAGKSPKMDYVKDLVKQMLIDEPSGKIVLFTEYERMARIILNEFKDIGVLYSGQISEKQKDYVVERFRNDPETKIFVGTRAASTGLNLQVANHLIHFDLPFAATDIEQRNGRIDRSGNLFPNITIHYLIMEGSYEEQLLETLQRKSTVESEVLTGNKASSTVKNPGEQALKKLMKKRQKQLH